jgi:hypothetical protein
VDAHRVAERRQQPAREELHALEFLQRPGARQQLLEAVLVLLHGACTPTLGQLEQRRRA